MEGLLKELASSVALAAEMACVLCIAIGGLLTVLKLGTVVIRGQASNRHFRREIWRTFAVWILLALEFALGADIARTAIAPTWDEIGQLAAIAVIRTALNFFLERDLEALSPAEEAAKREAAA